MIVLYLTEYICGRYAVAVEHNGCVKVQKFENISDDEYNLFYIKPLTTFLVKSEVRDMTMMSRAFDKSVYDANTNLPKISEENGKHRWVHIGGDKVSSFLTHDDIFNYVSNMGLNITPYSIALGEKKTFIF